MRLISLKLPEPLAVELDDVAQDRNVSRSELIREAVTDFLDASRASGPRALSVLDVAGDLVGSVDGPGDLSTNPDHMAGYGR